MSYVSWLRERADELRANMTPSEIVINNKFKKLKIRFKTQVPIMVTEDRGFIADFLLFGNIILEVDGDSHKPKTSQIYDQERTELLETKGYKVVRISNGSVHNKTKLVNELIRIMDEIDTNEARYCLYRLRTQMPVKSKKKEQKTKKKKDYRYDPDFKRKLFAVNGW